MPSHEETVTEAPSPGAVPDGAASSLLDPVTRALKATWIGFWGRVEVYGATILFFSFCYGLLVIYLKAIAPEVFQLRDSGPVSEDGLAVGVLLSPLSLLIAIAWNEVRSRHEP
jgi:hypothetical protein